MKHAVVTGGGSGIGRAISKKLAADGCHVVILEKNPEAGEEVVAEIENSAGSAEVLPCDVSATGEVSAVFERLERCDILVNNAGLASIGNVENTTPEELDRIYSVNVKGVFHCLHFAIPKMLAHGGGAILSLASIASKIGIRDRFAYSMSKGAVLTMTLSVARDYVEKNIRANCLCPARVHTPFVDGFLEKNYPPEQREEMFRQLSEYQPLGRMGTPEEIADLAAFLCSEKAAFITGSAYDIDGGVTNLR